MRGARWYRCVADAAAVGMQCRYVRSRGYGHDRGWCKRVPTEQYPRDDGAEMGVMMQVTRIQQMDTIRELHLLRRCEYGTHATEEARSVSRPSVVTPSRLIAADAYNQRIQPE